MQVDDEFELAGVDHRQIAGLRALEDLTGVDTDLTKRVCNIRPVARQPADLGKRASFLGCGNSVMRCERRKLHGLDGEEHVGINEESIGAIAHQGGEGRFNLPAGAGVEDHTL